MSDRDLEPAYFLEHNDDGTYTAKFPVLGLERTAPTPGDAQIQLELALATSPVVREATAARQAGAEPPARPEPDGEARRSIEMIRAHRELTDDTIDEAVAEGRPMVVEIWAEWCQPCLAMAPAITEVAEHFHGRVEFAQVDMDAHPGVRARYKLSALNTLLFFRDGVEVHRVFGHRGANVLSREVQERLLDG